MHAVPSSIPHLAGAHYSRASALPTPSPAGKDSQCNLGCLASDPARGPRRESEARKGRVTTGVAGTCTGAGHQLRGIYREMRSLQRGGQRVGERLLFLDCG